MPSPASANVPPCTVSCPLGDALFPATRIMLVFAPRNAEFDSCAVGPVSASQPASRTPPRALSWIVQLSRRLSCTVLSTTPGPEAPVTCREERSGSGGAGLMPLPHWGPHWHSSPQSPPDPPSP